LLLISVAGDRVKHLTCKKIRKESDKQFMKIKDDNDVVCAVDFGKANRPLAKFPNQSIPVFVFITSSSLLPTPYSLV
jgi:hypothetical protein